MNFKLLLSILFIVAFWSCKNTPSKYIYDSGMIHGTPYHVVYESPDGIDFQTDIDNKMTEYNMIFSTYEKESIISKVNRNEEVELDPIFTDCFNRAMEISEITGGAFDITCGPLVNAWGFGPEEKKKMTPESVDSLLLLTGYKKVKLENGKVIKENPNMKLNMNAVGDGYFCDLIGHYLEKKGCKNYMVEIGGEVVGRGKNEKGRIWTIGINKPVDDNINVNNEIVARVQVSDKAMATSGNYRNFYIEDGKKYAHTIDPKTGYPVQHSILSASVVAKSGLKADGLATAFMVLDIEKSIELVKQIPGVEVYLIYADEQGNNKVYMSEGFKQFLLE